jgi:Nucleotidyl transferase AbiEii toxin, Type IV TA system
MSLDNIAGFEHFAKFFSEFRDHYVVIGGIATIFSLEAAGALGRPTKDIDLVVLANPNKFFTDKLREYITNGGYQIESDAEQGSRNYRFRKPLSPDFPFQIEIFSTVPLNMELRDGQVIVPFSTSPGLKSLSAILMDTDYFNLMKTCITQDGGVPLLTINALIPLKARAFIDLSERRATGEKVDQKDIKKHRNDVLRLSTILGDSKRELPATVARDLVKFFDHPDIAGLTQDTFQTIVNDANRSMMSLQGQVLEYYRLK